MTALVPLAAFGLNRVCGRVGGAGRFGPAAMRCTAICVLACAVTIADLSFVPVPTSSVSRTPAAYAIVKQTKAGILAEYPLVNPTLASNAGYVFWQRRHGRPLLNGANFGTTANSVRQMLVDPRAPGTAGSLALLGVTTIVTRSTTYDWTGLTHYAEPESYGPGYALVGTAGDARVWRVVASPAPAIAAYSDKDVDEPVPPSPGGFVIYPVERNPVELRIYAKRPGTWWLRFRVVGAGPRLILEVAGVKGRYRLPIQGRAEASIPIAVPAGRSTLQLVFLRSGGGARTSEGARIALSTASFSATHGEVASVLEPALAASDPGF